LRIKPDLRRYAGGPLCTTLVSAIYTVTRGVGITGSSSRKDFAYVRVAFRGTFLLSTGTLEELCGRCLVQQHTQLQLPISFTMDSTWLKSDHLDLCIRQSDVYRTPCSPPMQPFEGCAAHLAALSRAKFVLCPRCPPHTHTNKILHPSASHRSCQLQQHPSLLQTAICKWCSCIAG
jgi:hypothetical protein